MRHNVRSVDGMCCVFAASHYENYGSLRDRSAVTESGAFGVLRRKTTTALPFVLFLFRFFFLCCFEFRFQRSSIYLFCISNREERVRREGNSKLYFLSRRRSKRIVLQVTVVRPFWWNDGECAYEFRASDGDTVWKGEAVGMATTTAKTTK